jgi:hypothetical protein
MFGFEYPDLIKIDVQGAEMDVLLGAQECLQSAQDLILELQSDDYNMGSPKFEEVKTYLESIGFELVVKEPFSKTLYDGDYHFSKCHRQ